MHNATGFMFAVTITQEVLSRIEWLFDDKRPRIAYAGRNQTRFTPRTDGTHVPLEDTIQTSFGRYHMFVRTTNGATMDMQISCAVKGINHDKNVYLQVYKGKSPKSYHFVATTAREGCIAVKFEMVRMPFCIKLNLGKYSFKILAADIATGSGKSTSSPMSILFGEADRFRFNTDVDFTGPEKGEGPVVWENPKQFDEEEGDDAMFVRSERPVRGGGRRSGVEVIDLDA